MNIDKKQIRQIYKEMIPIRRHIHSTPELSGFEFETKKQIDSYLEKWNIETIDLSMENASLGIVHGKSPGKTLAIRADIDALPILEKTEVDFASTNGAMHACGHDMHTAILLGTAKYIQSKQEDLKGSVKFIFQPDEEKNGGAEPMIQAGAMEGVDYVFGLHVNPNYPCGNIAFRKGFFNASVDDFTIRVKGKGGHGAHPHKSNDTVLASAHIITAIQSLISRRVSPLDPAVISVGTIHGGSKENILPSIVEMTGTLRAAREETRDYLFKEIKHLSSSIAKSMHMEIEFEVRYGFIPLVNHIEETTRLHSACLEVFEPDQVHWIPEASMGGDDFAYFLKEAPGTYYSLGIGREGVDNPPIHSEYFNPDEEAIYYGILSQIVAIQEFLG